MIKAARAGKRAIHDCLADGAEIIPDRKEDGSLLTAADLASQEAILDALQEAFPGVPVLSEENATDTYDISNGPWLIVDPLDGTTNFSRGIPFCSITIAYLVNGIPHAGIVMPVMQPCCYAAVKDGDALLIQDTGEQSIIKCKSRPLDQSVLCVTGDSSDPAGREQWWAWLERVRPPYCFRLRLLEASALELCLLAEGKIDGYLHSCDKPWDMAAAGLIVQQAGGRLFNNDGGPWSVNTNGVIAFSPEIADTIVKRISEKG